MSNVERITTGIVEQLQESLGYIVELESTIEELSDKGMLDGELFYSLLPDNDFDYRKTLTLLKEHSNLFLEPVNNTVQETAVNLPKSEIKIDKFISLVKAIRDVYNSNKSNDEKHHIIFYEYMSIAQLWDADPFLMESYFPTTSSNAGEILHLLTHVECKYNYLKSLKGDK